MISSPLVLGPQSYMSIDKLWQSIVMSKLVMGIYIYIYLIRL
jgi:hypothetical protein